MTWQLEKLEALNCDSEIPTRAARSGRWTLHDYGKQIVVAGTYPRKETVATRMRSAYAQGHLESRARKLFVQMAAHLRVATS